MSAAPHIAADSADPAAQWRQRAERLRALAALAQHSHARAEMLALADRWDILAAQAEGRRPESRHRLN